jgi:hypothetical protein
VLGAILPGGLPDAPAISTLLSQAFAAAGLLLLSLATPSGTRTGE